MRTADLLRAFEERLAKTVLRYLAAHGYRTAADYGASVGVRDGGELPDVDAVPKVYGLPGASSKLKRGVPVYVVFKGGDGGAPVVAFYPEGCTATELGLDAETLIRLGGPGATALATAAGVNAALANVTAAITALGGTVAPYGPIHTTKVIAE